MTNNVIPANISIDEAASKTAMINNKTLSTFIITIIVISIPFLD